MTTRTKVVFFLIVGFAATLVAGILGLERLLGVTVPTRSGAAVTITVAVAPELEMWAQEAARDFNATHRPTTVNIVTLKGLNATQTLDLSKGESLPDAWIAEADFVRQMARGVPYEANGPSVAQASLVWVEVAGRNKLTAPADWPAVHEAAVNNPQFRAALPSPSNSVIGVAAYLSALAAFHNNPALSPEMVSADFQTWMEEILVAVPEQTRAPLDQLSRTPPSVDVGLLLEDELTNLNLSQFNRQSPAFNVVFNFPYLIRQGGGVVADETEAEAHRQAAARFLDFLLEAGQQNRLPNYGLRPAGRDVSGQTVQADGPTAERIWSQYR